MIKFVVGAVIAAGLVAFNQESKTDDDKKVDLKGIKCVVNSKGAAKAEKVVELKDGSKLYMCCGNCVKAYNKDPEKFATKANHQRVATGQFVQKACPFSGGKLNDSATVKVGAIELKMCCGNCAKKVNSQETEAAKAELVFSAKAFKKGFEKKAAEEKK